MSAPIDPITYQHAAMQWLEEHGYTWGGAFFAALPMVTYEGKTFGANFGVIPNIPSQKIEGAFVVQLKFKAF